MHIQEKKISVSFNDVTAQWHQIKESVQDKIFEYFESGKYIEGPYVSEFEHNFSNYTKSKFSIAVSNGTDGLKLAIQTLAKKGKNLIIIPANTFIADPLAVSQQIHNHEIEFEIKLIDCDEFYQIDILKLEEYLSKNNNKYDNLILMAVHLYGHPANMDKINELKKIYNFHIIEDASQAHGAEINNKIIGNYGDITVYSLYPGKNLGAAGDAGIITTNILEYSEKIKSLKNYGSVKKYYYDDFGWNHRMDGIQAIILNEKLKHLEYWNNLRSEFAKSYDEKLSELNNYLITPKTAQYCTKNVYHIYCIRVNNREGLQKHLSDNGITTLIHYPVPINKTSIYKYLDHEDLINTTNWCDNILSLPIHPFMNEDQIDFITDKIKEFYL